LNIEEIKFSASRKDVFTCLNLKDEEQVLTLCFRRNNDDKK